MTRRAERKDGAGAKSRRRFLRDAGLGGGGAILLLASLSACREGGKTGGGPHPVVVRLSDLSPGKRVVVTWGDEPVEVMRTGGRVRALSLLCTHFGCRVRWKEREAEYHCPCHGGRFDAEGRVLLGPPTRPLRRVPATVTATEVIVGG